MVFYLSACYFMVGLEVSITNMVVAWVVAAHPWRVRVLKSHIAIKYVMSTMKNRTRLSVSTGWATWICLPTGDDDCCRWVGGLASGAQICTLWVVF